MTETQKRQALGYGLMGLTVLLYFLRPWSCTVALAQFSPMSEVSYSQFDSHGFSAGLGWLVSLAWAIPVFALAYVLFRGGAYKLMLFGYGADRNTTLISVLIALIIGAPMATQIAYMGGLPFRIAAPVWISALAWLLLVELARNIALQLPLGSKTVRAIIAMAILLGVGRLVVLGTALFVV